EHAADHRGDGGHDHDINHPCEEARDRAGQEEGEIDPLRRADGQGVGAGGVHMARARKDNDLTSPIVLIFSPTTLTWPSATLSRSRRRGTRPSPLPSDGSGEGERGDAGRNVWMAAFISLFVAENPCPSRRISTGSRSARSVPRGRRRSWPSTAPRARDI